MASHSRRLGRLRTPNPSSEVLVLRPKHLTQVILSVDENRMSWPSTLWVLSGTPSTVDLLGQRPQKDDLTDFHTSWTSWPSHSSPTLSNIGQCPTTSRLFASILDCHTPNMVIVPESSGARRWTPDLRSRLKHMTSPPITNDQSPVVSLWSSDIDTGLARLVCSVVDGRTSQQPACYG